MELLPSYTLCVLNERLRPGLGNLFDMWGMCLISQPLTVEFVNWTQLFKDLLTPYCALEQLQSTKAIGKSFTKDVEFREHYVKMTFPSSIHHGSPTAMHVTVNDPLPSKTFAKRIGQYIVSSPSTVFNSTRTLLATYVHRYLGNSPWQLLLQSICYSEVFCG